MNYIVFDLEFNQEEPLLPGAERKAPTCPFEIIQIGALKLDSAWNTIATLNRFVKPTIYTEVSSFITELTGITTEQLRKEESFKSVYQDLMRFIGEDEAVFVSWGKSDIKELYRNVEYFNQDEELLPNKYIDLQPYASLYLKQSVKKLLRLSYMVENLSIPQAFPFHDALGDAYYTAEIFKKIMKPSIKPRVYEPSSVTIKTSFRPRPPKKIIDFGALYLQFERMYGRSMTAEERGIIKLAYQMGKTEQFVTSEHISTSASDEFIEQVNSRNIFDNQTKKLTRNINNKT